MRKLLTTILILVSGIICFSQPLDAVPVSPDKYFFDLKEGEIKQEKLILYGKVDLEGTQEVYIYPMVMQKIGEENDRSFYYPNKDDSSLVANWINLSITQATLTKGSIVEIPWTITKKGNPNCGTNLAAIFVSTTPPKIEQNVAIALKGDVASQIHVNLTSIAGKDCENAKASLSLIEFKINRRSKIFTSVDVPFLTRIMNKGELISRAPEGFIEINGYGGKVNIPFNNEGLDIYPSTTRKFTNVWFDPNYPKDGSFFTKLGYEIKNLRFGRYTAKLGVTKNANPQIIEEVPFWIIPWRILLVVFIILSIVTGLIYYNIRSRREIKKLKNASKKL